MSWKLWRVKSKDNDLDEEIAHDLAAEAEENIQSGMSPEQAARASRRDFGNVLLTKEVTRETWAWSGLERLSQDVRYGLRQIARSPGFAAVAVLSLGLGIGANTAIFTLINLVMLKPLPVSHHEALVRLTVTTPGSSKPSGFSEALWQQLRDHQDVFDRVFAYGSTGGADLSAGGEARPVAVNLVTGGFFSTLGVRAAVGRTLTDADDRRGFPGVAVISHGFWQREYGGHFRS